MSEGKGSEVLPEHTMGRGVRDGLDTAQTILGRMAGLYDAMAAGDPSLARNRVWCRTCGRSQANDSANSLRHGWPKCCGCTMTIDAPGEDGTTGPSSVPGGPK